MEDAFRRWDVLSDEQRQAARAVLMALLIAVCFDDSSFCAGKAALHKLNIIVVQARPL